MNLHDIKTILIKRGYNSERAELVANELTTIDLTLHEPLNRWLNAGVETDINVNGISLLELMRTYNLKYPAALLSIDWIIKNPKEALSVIRSKH